MERKINEEVLRTVREKLRCIFLTKMLEELHNLILEGMIEGNKNAGCPRNSYVGQIKCDARANTYKELKKRRATVQIEELVL